MTVGTDSVLHLTTGDVNAGRLREAGLPGEVVACIDALHEGPTPASVTSEAWLALRARFAADQGWTTEEHARARLAEGEQALERAADGDEIVVWVEHDLVCQFALVCLLDRLAVLRVSSADARRDLRDSRSSASARSPASSDSTGSET